MTTTKRLRRRKAATATVTPPRQERSLQQLAREIKVEHDAAEAGMRDYLAHAHRAGDLLREVKGKLDHGQFIPWVEQHCDFTLRTAQLYMFVARHWDEIVNAQRVAHLPLRRAVQVLAAESESASADTDPPVGRVADTYLTESKRFLVAIQRAQGQAERLRSTVKVVTQRHEDIRTALAQLDKALADPSVDLAAGAAAREVS